MKHNLFEFQLSARSDSGRRVENQDNFLIIDGNGKAQTLVNQQLVIKQKPDWPEGHVRILAADGMGGHQHGREAAEALMDALYEMPFQKTLKSLYKQLVTIHKNLNKSFNLGSKTPGSTLVLAEITPRGLGMIANIGDSRAYHQQNNQWQQLSCDHTDYEFAYRDQEIDPEQYQQCRRHPTGKIAQAMIYGSCGIIADDQGNKPARHSKKLRIEKPDLFYIPLVSGDCLWIGTDGLWSYHPENRVDFPEIQANDLLDQILANQHQRASAQGSKDNVTSVLLRVHTKI